VTDKVIQARVMWENEVSGARGHSPWMDAKEAQSIADTENKQHNFTRHWIEYKPDGDEVSK
jgi:hypothetical protein